jgi:tetratricopeptide (TPR) repeat protein
MGNILCDIKKPVKAIEAYKKALALNEKDSDLINNLGIAYITLKQYNESIKVFNKGLEQNPTDSNIMFNLGIAYCLRNDNDNAVKILERAGEIDKSIVDKIKTNKIFKNIQDKFE